MAISRGVDRHFRRPGQQKSCRKGKTSGDANRKCSKGQTVTFNNSRQQVLSEGLDRKGRVLERLHKAHTASHEAQRYQIDIKRCYSRLWHAAELVSVTLDQAWAFGHKKV